MALLTKKQTEQQGTLTTIGTVAEFVGVGGYAELASVKNFKGTKDANGNLILKKVSVKLVKADDTFAYVNCSKPVGDYLRASKSAEELKQRMIELTSLNILALPQIDVETGEPVMRLNEETGEMEALVLYVISNTGGADMSNTRVAIDKEAIAAKAKTQQISFEDLIAF